MGFERFFGVFPLTGRVDAEPPPTQGRAVEGFEELMSKAAGGSFADGMYRLHSAATAERMQPLVEAGFHESAQETACFGFDWLGRQFALDFKRSHGDEPLITLFEPGTGEALEIPVGFADFHEFELCDHTDAAVAASGFAEWRSRHPGAPPLPHGDCVGYSVPLFLGGPDEITNMELVNTERYWMITGQLMDQARGLGPGADIRQVWFEE